MKKGIGSVSDILKKYTGKLIVCILFAVMNGALSVTGTLYIGRVLDITSSKGDVDFAKLRDGIILLSLIYIGTAFSSFVLMRLSAYISQNSVRDIRGRMFEKLGHLPISFIDSNPKGDIISRFIGDLDSVGDGMVLAINNLFTGVTTIVMALWYMLRLNLRLTMIILVITPITFAVAYAVARFTHDTFAKQQRRLGDMTSYLTEIVGNEKVVKALGYEGTSIERFGEINTELYNWSSKAQLGSALINPTARFVDHLSYIAVGLISGMLMLGEISTTGAAVTVGTITTFLLYSTQFAKPFNEISGIAAQIQTAYAAMERVNQFFEFEEELPDFIPPQNVTDPKGVVEFEDVDFSYEKNNPLITGLNFRADAEKLIAIVGSTGSGKTTLVNLLMRFYEIDSGVIMVDGVDIRKMSRDSLRRMFGMVLQDTWLFSGTVADNIAYARPKSTREEIIAVAKSAHAHSFIKQLKDGYDTVLEEEGGNLSGGQRQLLSIARVMLMNPPMLILDEATSSVDTLTEVRLQKALNKLMGGRTSLVIAHRLSTIENADHILVMEKGKILEQGNHKNLLKKGGRYSELYYSQFDNKG